MRNHHLTVKSRNPNKKVQGEKTILNSNVIFLKKKKKAVSGVVSQLSHQSVTF